MDELQVLCIEDSEDDVILLKRSLKRGGLEAKVLQVCNEKELRSALANQAWDIVICDYLMPEIKATTALSVVRELEPDLPFIILSGTISDEAAVSMMKAGAQDYILKDNLSRLIPAIRREIQEAKIRREKRLTEESLLESEMRQRLLLESMTDIIFVLNQKGYVVEYYSKKSLLPDLMPEEMLGKHLSDIFDTGTTGVFMSLLPKVIAQRQPFLFDFISHVGGIRKWHSANLTPHHDNESIVVVIRDISDVKLVEEQLRAANHMSNLYLDIMGHDIRNYLQAIMISAELLSEQQQNEFVQRIIDTVGKCEKLINSIEVTAELPVIALEDYDLVKILQNEVDMFRAQHKDIMVNVEFLIESAPVMADRFVKHVFSSILDNAKEHGKGKTTDIWVSLREMSRGYEVSISDNGPGIPDKKKSEVLDAERRFGGIGLHQVKQIIVKYGGKIEITDRISGNPESGAKFIIWLPKIKQS